MSSSGPSRDLCLMVELSGKPISLAVIRSLVDACGQFDLFSNKAFNKIARVLRDDIRGSCHYCFCDGKTRKSTGTVCSQLTAQLYFVLCLDIGLFNLFALFGFISASSPQVWSVKYNSTGSKIISAGDDRAIHIYDCPMWRDTSRLREDLHSCQLKSLIEIDNEGRERLKL